MSDHVVDVRGAQRPRPLVKRSAEKDARPPDPRKRRRKTGKAPPPLFDFDKLSDSTLLDTAEVAAVLRKAIGTVEGWRKEDSTHPLARDRVEADGSITHVWEYIDGKPRLRVGKLRSYMKGEKP